MAVAAASGALFAALAFFALRLDLALAADVLAIAATLCGIAVFLCAAASTFGRARRLPRSRGAP